MLAATRSTPVDETRYRWLYESNPDGPAIMWSIRDIQSGEMAGFTVCLPRRMQINGRLIQAWNGADFSILPKYRTLGAALKLRRAAKQEIDCGNATLLYSHPNARMQVIHERVGHDCVGRMLRWAKPTRISEHLPEPLKASVGPIMDRALAPILFRHSSRSGNRSAPTLAIECDPRFGEDFDGLFSETPCTRSIVGVRDSRYLDWRYRQHPGKKFFLIRALEFGRLSGYLIFAKDGASLAVQDIYAKSTDTAANLLAELDRHSRKYQVRSISMALLEQSDLIPVLSEMGFRERRDHSYMFTYAALEDLRAIATDPRHWMIHVGDRDV